MDKVFKKDILKNLNIISEYEWLERNNKGCYSYSTIIGMNTRREHGMFVAPSYDFAQKIVLLSKFEESIFVDNTLYEISTNQYSHNIFPHGYKYLDEFRLHPIPTFNFKVEDRLVTKRLFLCSDENILVVRYELKNQGKPVKIIIKPFLTARYNNRLTDKIQGMNTDSYLGHNSVRWAPRSDLPQLYTYFNTGEYVTATLWYHKFYYTHDSLKYAEQVEDLLNPGFFQVTLKPYNHLDLFVSTGEIPDFELDYESLFRRELERRQLEPISQPVELNRIQELKDTVRQSIISPTGKNFISISTINTQNQLRDILFSIPGLYFPKKQFKEFKNIFNQIADLLEDGLLPLSFPNQVSKNQYAAADLSLWLIHLAYQYLEESDDAAFFDGKLYDKMRSIIDYYMQGTKYNIYKDKDNLIFSGDRNVDLSWSSSNQNSPDQVRYGKLVEINALWYNALCILEYLSKRLNKTRFTNKYQKTAKKVKDSFNKVFLDKDNNAFYDYIANDVKSTEFNINQLIPLALPFRMISDEFARNVLKNIDELLLTPYGIRVCPFEKQKTSTPCRNLIKPSAIHLYLQICLYYKPFAEDIFDYFTPLMDLTSKGLLGFIPEYVANGAEDYTHEGIPDYTTSLASLIYADYVFRK